MKEVGYKGIFCRRRMPCLATKKHSKICETDEMAYIATNTGLELSKLDGFNKNNQMTFMVHHFGESNVSIICLTGATFGELDHYAALF